MNDTPSTSDSTQSDLDRVNLVQALKDFEIANARVVDLTGRLSAAANEIAELRSDLLRSQAEASRLRADVEYFSVVSQGLPFRAGRAFSALAAKASRR